MVGIRGHKYLEYVDCWDLLGIDPNGLQPPTVPAVISRAKLVLRELSAQRYVQDQHMLTKAYGRGHITAFNASCLLVTLQSGKYIRHILPDDFPRRKTSEEHARETASERARTTS